MKQFQSDYRLRILPAFFELALETVGLLSWIVHGFAFINELDVDIQNRPPIEAQLLVKMPPLKINLIPIIFAYIKPPSPRLVLTVLQQPLLLVPVTVFKVIVLYIRPVESIILRKPPPLQALLLSMLTELIVTVVAYIAETS